MNAQAVKFYKCLELPNMTLFLKKQVQSIADLRDACHTVNQF